LLFSANLLCFHPHSELLLFIRNPFLLLFVLVEAMENSEITLASAEPEFLTIKVLKELLDKEGVKYPSSATKAVYVQLVQNVKQQHSYLKGKVSPLKKNSSPAKSRSPARKSEEEWIPTSTPSPKRKREQHLKETSKRSPQRKSTSSSPTKKSQQASRSSSSLAPIEEVPIETNDIERKKVQKSSTQRLINGIDEESPIKRARVDANQPPPPPQQQQTEVSAPDTTWSCIII
jgi:hypothetical protein